MAKRKRCGPSLFPTTPPCSPSRGIGVKRAKRRLEVDDHYSPPSTSSALSPFINAAPPIQTDKLLAHVEQELKRLQRRKVFTSDASSSSTHSQLQSQVAGSGSTGKDQPLFTLKQVTVVCQRMLKEREEQIRGEYDKVLITKLAEQYDAFVKFSHDQVERRLAESAFSYVS